MSKRQKIIEKILQGNQISINEAKALLKRLGYEERIRGSHHNFAKPGFDPFTLTNKSQLPKYQMDILKEVLEENGY